MPANLTPEYEKADLRYRRAGSDEERLEALEEMLAAIPKHKGTEKMQADLKRRLYSSPQNEIFLSVASISMQWRQGLEELFARLWELLARIRVYAKKPGRPADLHKPFVLPFGATVADLARHIHRDLPDQMKFARLWGHSRFDGQQVHKTESLQDRDVVEIHE